MTAVDLISTAEAAAILGVADSRIRQMIRAGALPARRIGGRWVVNPADLEAHAAPSRRGWPRSKPRKETAR